VFSTETTRTRSTAAPTAEQAQVAIAPYNPQGAEGMAAFAQQLLTTPARALVVGHSNTTPELVEALGGDAVVPMTDDDYDRLYILTVGPDGTVSSALLHFGAPAGGD
jgi:probable phosphoglycerate mutase